MKKSFILLIFIKAYLCTTEKSDNEDEYENNDSNESSEDNFYRDGDDETKEYFDETTPIFPIPPLNSTTTTVWPNLTNSLSRTRPTPPPFNSTFTESEEECDTTTSETDTTTTDDTTIPPTIFNLTTSSANISTPSSNSTTTTESSTLSETDTTTTDMDTTTITEGGK